MSAQDLNEEQRADALVLSAVLRSSSFVLGLWSLGLSLIAFGIIFFLKPSLVTQSLWALVLVCGLVERYFAFRLALDGDLFHQLGRSHMPDLNALDASLSRLRLRTQATPHRSWGERLAGTRQLLRRHSAIVGFQTVTALASLLM